MRPSEALAMHRDAIRQMVLEAGMANPRVFGSAVHGDDREDSDVDLLVDPSPETSLLDLAKLRVALEGRFGVRIDLLTPKSLPPQFRGAVLSEAIPL